MLTDDDFHGGPNLDYPPCTWYGVVQYSYDGDENAGTITITENEIVIVQGDRAGPSAGWLFGVAAGQTGLMPSAYIEPLPRQQLYATVLYDFEAAEETELSCTAGTFLHLTPSARDPPGWCSALNPASTHRLQGLVPQTYLGPEVREPSPSGPASLSAAIPPAATPTVTPVAALESPRRMATPVTQVIATVPSASSAVAATARQGSQKRHAVGVGYLAEPAPAPLSEPIMPSQAAASSSASSSAGKSPLRSLRSHPTDSASDAASPNSQRSRVGIGRGIALDESGRLLQPDEEVAGFVAGQWSRRKSHERLKEAAASRKALLSVPPPVGFKAAEAMDQIFQLGWLIAKGGSETDHTWWQARIDELGRGLRAWSAWEDDRPRREHAAAATIQSQALAVDHPHSLNAFTTYSSHPLLTHSSTHSSNPLLIPTPRIHSVQQLLTTSPYYHSLNAFTTY